MIKAAFWGSLQPYEAQYHKFELTFLLPTDVGNGICFDPPIELSPETLGRLAPALVPGRTRVAVSALSDAAPNELFIRAHLPHPPTRAVEVVAAAPGHVVVRWGLERLAIIRDSAQSLIVQPFPNPPLNRVEEQMFTPGHYHQAHALDPSHLAGLLAEMLPDVKKRHIVGCVLLMLAHEMRSHRRGGAIIVWTANNKEDWEESIKIPHPLSRYQGLAEHVRRLVAEASTDLDRDKVPADIWNYLAGRHSAINPELLEQLMTVGRLTAVDGALLVSDNLEVIGYGAKITVKPPENASQPLVRKVPDVISGWIFDPEKHARNVSELGGTRHQSACHLVTKHNNASVIVCSQDGPLSAMWFIPNGGRVVVLQQLEAMMD